MVGIKRTLVFSGFQSNLKNLLAHMRSLLLITAGKTHGYLQAKRSSKCNNSTEKFDDENNYQMQLSSKPCGQLYK